MDARARKYNATAMAPAGARNKQRSVFRGSASRSLLFVIFLDDVVKGRQIANAQMDPLKVSVCIQGGGACERQLLQQIEGVAEPETDGHLEAEKAGPETPPPHTMGALEWAGAYVYTGNTNLTSEHDASARIAQD